MSITDELRKFAWEECPNRLSKRVIGIARDIDNKYEACADFAHRLEDAASKGEEVTIFGTDYIPLPKDADGETIHLGDRLRHENGEFIVNDMSLSRDCLWRAWDAENGCIVLLRNSTHAKPDSWERILKDMAQLGHDDDPSNIDLAKYVERCKRLAGEDA